MFLAFLSQNRRVRQEAALLLARCPSMHFTDGTTEAQRGSPLAPVYTAERCKSRPSNMPPHCVVLSSPPPPQERTARVSICTNHTFQAFLQHFVPRVMGHWLVMTRDLKYLPASIPGPKAPWIPRSSLCELLPGPAMKLVPQIVPGRRGRKSRQASAAAAPGGGEAQAGRPSGLASIWSLRSGRVVTPAAHSSPWSRRSTPPSSFPEPVGFALPRGPPEPRPAMARWKETGLRRPTRGGGARLSRLQEGCSPRPRPPPSFPWHRLRAFPAAWPPQQVKRPPARGASAGRSLPARRLPAPLHAPSPPPGLRRLPWPPAASSLRVSFSEDPAQPESPRAEELGALCTRWTRAAAGRALAGALRPS